ncbi:MAG TPA: hypothetical protein VN258_03095 [Mobilitalea sp.]|nr:hypothetical protein [Mobilitalea sp.]
MKLIRKGSNQIKLSKLVINRTGVAPVAVSIVRAAFLSSLISEDRSSILEE